MAVTLCGKCFEEVEHECMCEDNPSVQKAIREAEFLNDLFRRGMFRRH